MNTKQEVSLKKIIKVRDFLKRIYDARPIPLNEVYRTALIKGFEMCFELTWKTLRKVLIFQGIIDAPTSPRAVFNLAEQEKLINGLEFWHKCINMRNESTHAYDEDAANDVYEFIPEFLTNVDKMLEKLTAMDLGNK